MSTRALVIYEILYTVIFFGLVCSQETTILTYFPNASLAARIILLCFLFSGFFIPSYLKLLRIKFTIKHYVSLFILFLFLYIVASTYYYSIELLDSTELKERRYNTFFQVSPNEQNSEIPKPAGVFRILLLGGSTTRGKGARGYADPLEEMLLRKYPRRKIEVVNAGKQFYNSQHSIMQYLFYVKDMDPDMIILFHGMNDLLPSFTMPPWSSSPFRKDYGHFTGILNLIRPYPETFEKFLYGFFYADLRKPTLKPVSFSDFRSLYSFRRNLETLIEITKYKGIHLILSNQAHCFSDKNETDIHYLGYPQWFPVDSEHYADEMSWHEGMTLFNRTTKEIAEKFSIPFVEQVSAFQGKKELFRDVLHMTDAGTELKARLFFDKIVELGLLEETEGSHLN